MSEFFKEVPVLCPNCRRVHYVPVEEAKRNAHITLPCGVIIGSLGVLNRLNHLEEKARKFQNTLYKLDE